MPSLLLILLSLKLRNAKLWLVKCPFYTLERWEIDGKYSFENDKPFINASVIDGSGMINGQKIGKGEHFIIPATLKQCNIEGKLTVMISYC